MTSPWWDKLIFGRSGLRVSRLGIGASYGIGEADVERAFERGVNLMYWGSRRRAGMGRALRRIARRRRDELVVMVQSYSRSKLALAPSVELALRRLDTEYADVLLLGLWNKPPPTRILDAALTLREAGKVRAIAISCHHRPTFARYIHDPCYDAIMVRYNAAHRGAETEVFPELLDDLPDGDAPGVLAYTATRWGALLDRKMVSDGEPVPRASDCYRFALSHPQVQACLCGPRDAAELDEAMAALDRGPMDADELAWMRRVGDGVHAASAVRAARSPALLWDRVTSALRGLGG